MIGGRLTLYNMIHKRARYRSMSPDVGYNLLTSGQGQASGTFIRATAASYNDYEGILRTAPTGVARWDGGRYVQNLLLNSASPATQSVSLTAGKTYLLWVTGTGSVVVSGGSGATGTATSATPLLLTITGTVSATFTVSGTVSTFQLEDITGSSYQLPSEYVPTTSASAGKWFFNHPTTKAPLSARLLMEGAGENKLPYYTNLDDWSIQYNAAKSTVTALRPNGSTGDTARLILDMSQPFSALRRSVVGLDTGLKYTLSLWVKSNTGTNQTFDLAKYCTTYLTSDPFIATTSWKRFSFTFSINTANIIIYCAHSNPTISADLLIYGAQLEASSVATSDIPTTTSAAPRNADTLSWPLTDDLKSILSIDKKWKTSFANGTGLTWNSEKNLCSFADGQSWIGHTDADLSSHANKGRMVILRDSSGRLAWGYLGAAGPGITYSERIANGDLSTATGWDTDKDGSTGTFTISGGVATATGATRLISQDVLSLKKTYRHSFDLTSYTSGVFYQYVGIGSQGRIANGSYVAHLCATNSIHAGVYAVTATGVVDNISVQEMLTPPSTGLYVYKDAARTTQGWNMEASFGLNGTSYTFDVVGDCSIEGTIAIDFTPGYTQSNASGDIGVLSPSNAAKNLLYHDATAYLKGYDGTNNPTAAKTLVAGTTYKLVARWSAAGFQVSIKDTSWTHGAASAFDGAFTLGTVLNLSYGNALPVKYGNLRIFPRYLTDAEVARL